MRIASLPFYDLSEVRPALDALWEGIARRLRCAGLTDVPEALGHDVDCAAQWNSGQLLLSQACGYDAVFEYAERLRIVGTPMFDLEGCHGPNYRSFIIVRTNSSATRLADLRGQRCVINTPASHSGMNILRALVAPLHLKGRFFASVLVSGAHETSIRAVRDEIADVASIDCITYGLLARHRPRELEGTRVIQETTAIAAPPFVTDTGTSDDEVTELLLAIEAVLAEPDSPGHQIGLRGIARLDPDAYRPVADFAEIARRLGYEELNLPPDAPVSSALGPRAAEG